MKIVIFSLFTVVFFSCSNMNSKSAFVGEVPKSNVALVGTLSAESLYQLSDTFQTQDNKNVTLSPFALSHYLCVFNINALSIGIVKKNGNNN
jgi:uncharacterized protein with PQ loop repeat